MGDGVCEGRDRWKVLCPSAIVTDGKLMRLFVSLDYTYICLQVGVCGCECASLSCECNSM